MDKREKILASLVEVATAAYCGKLNRGKYNAVADQILALDVTGDLETWPLGDHKPPLPDYEAAINGRREFRNLFRKSQNELTALREQLTKSADMIMGQVAELQNLRAELERVKGEHDGEEVWWLPTFVLGGQGITENTVTIYKLKDEASALSIADRCIPVRIPKPKPDEREELIAEGYQEKSQVR